MYIYVSVCVCVVHNNNKQVWKSPVVSLLLGLEGIKMTLRIKKTTNKWIAQLKKGRKQDCTHVDHIQLEDLLPFKIIYTWKMNLNGLTGCGLMGTVKFPFFVFFTGQSNLVVGF